MVAVFLSLAACSPEDKPSGSNEENVYDPIPVERTAFAKGADISWVTQMESDGMKFYSEDGSETECTALMKSIGVNAIRLRVWVNPHEGWCGKEDVLEKAGRAQALGMDIMIDFHYSDTWADPGKQTTPAAWAGYDESQIAEAVAAHTHDILNTLKNNGISVKWVQVGNEVNSGMLHPLGNISNPSYISNFVRFFNAGYEAVKKVYPEAAVILHRSDGHDNAGFSWLLNVARAQELDYDMIGMSLYPSWWENGGYTSWETNTESCIANIRSFAKTYGKPVVICEFGMQASEPETAKEALSFIMNEARDMKELHGIFYWEPEVYGGWKPSSYESLGWSSYDKGAFKDGKPTAALEPFKQTIQ